MGGCSSRCSNTTPLDANANDTKMVWCGENGRMLVGYPNSSARAAADVASGKDTSAVAIDTYVRFGGVDKKEDVRHVVRWLLLRGLLIEGCNIEGKIADAPLHRVLFATESVLGPIGRVASLLDVPLLVPEVRLKPAGFLLAL